MTKLALLLVVFAGCFSSMVDDPCKDGYLYESGSCLARTTLPDAGMDVDVDGGGSTGDAMDPPDAPPPQVCVLPEAQCDDGCKNLQIDPDNCGACAHVCSSGLCTTGHCVGEPYGHIVAIGHDYANYHPSMARVLGNAASLGLSYDVGVAWWPQGTHAAVGNALSAALGSMGRPWHVQAIPATPSSLNSVDVLIIDGVTTAASGLAWAPSLDAFVRRGGVVIVVEGVGGTGHTFAAAANLFTTGTPVDVTNQQMVISSATDSIAAQVIAPYLGEGSSVSFPGTTSSVITTTSGATVVFHLVR